MKLRCISTYRAAGAAYDVGAVVECSEERGAWLQRDAPGCFELILDEPEIAGLVTGEAAFVGGVVEFDKGKRKRG